MIEPRIPVGSSSEVAWHVNLLRWIKSKLTIQIVGFKRTETSDGTIFEPNKSTNNTTNNQEDSIPRWG